MDLYASARVAWRHLNNEKGQLAAIGSFLTDVTSAIGATAGAVNAFRYLNQQFAAPPGSYASQYSSQPLASIEPWQQTTGEASRRMVARRQYQGYIRTPGGYQFGGGITTDGGGGGGELTPSGRPGRRLGAIYTMATRRVDSWAVRVWPRRMNVLNPHALRKAGRRLHGFMKRAHRMESHLPHRRARRAYARRRRR